MFLPDFLERCWADLDFVPALQRDPHGVLAGLGVHLPHTLRFYIHRNSEDEMHLVIPDRDGVGAGIEPDSALSAFVGRYYSEAALSEAVARDPNGALRTTGLELADLPRLKIHVCSETDRHFVVPIDPGAAELDERRRYALGGSMLEPRRGR